MASAPAGRAVRVAAWVAAGAVALTPAAVLAGVAVRADTRSRVEPPPPATAAPVVQGAVTTPLLSWRRVPATVVAPAARRPVDATAAALAGLVPPGACLMATVGEQPAVAVTSDVALVPASNQKVLTAITALAVLPVDHRARTAVVVAAAPDPAGVVGDLWLVGGGDRFLVTADRAPTWEGIVEPTRLEVLADAVVAAGVRRVDGRVLGDDSRYDRTRFLPSWPARYAAARVVVPLGALQVDGAGTFDDAPSPAAEAARRFAELLVARGVTVTGGHGEGTAPPGAVEVAGIDGPPLAEVVREVLTESDNTTGELLLREVALAAGQPPTTDAGAAVVAATVGPLLDAAGVPRTDVVVADGSGLSPANRLTCRALTAVLAAQPSDGPLAAGLAVAGRTGTLAERFAGSPATDRFRGKTGSIRDVLTLSGFVTDLGDRRWTFSLLANGPAAEATVRQWRPIVEAMAATPPGPSPADAAPLPARTP